MRPLKVRVVRRRPPSGRNRRAAEEGPAAAARSSCSSSLDDRLSADPFSILDPIGKQVVTAPMNLSASTPAGEERTSSGTSLPQWGSEPIASAETWTSLGSPKVDVANVVDSGGDETRTPGPDADASRASLLDL